MSDKGKSYLLFNIPHAWAMLLVKGRGELGAAFAAEHGNNSRTQRNKFATLSHDRAILLLPWAEDSHLLPLTKCKPSHVGISSNL